PVLAPVSRCCPSLRGRLLTCYSPVRHSLFIGIDTEWRAFDLHVLGTPPAFVLSQDQTLHRDFRSTSSRKKGPSKNQRVTMYDSSMVTTDRHFTGNESLDPSR